MRAAEFFSGIGLVRMALENERWQVVFANDNDEKKFAMYQGNFGGTDFRHCDIQDITSESVPKVDLATASFPCIDVSLAGNRAGLAGKHSSTFWEFARILKGMASKRPRWVLLENVLGLLTSNEGRDLREILRTLNSLGYACDIVVVDARFFVPQSRPRLFIIGKPPIPNSNNGLLRTHLARPKAVVDFILKNPGLDWSISNLSPLNIKRETLSQLLERFPDSSSIWWGNDRKKHLYSQMNELHREKLQTIVRSQSDSFATVYKRIREGKCRAELRTDGIAGCLRTPRGGSSKQFVIQAGRGRWRVRNMTAREYARLQGAPEFTIDVPENMALLGFGDAVCVPAVQWVIRNCISSNGQIGLRNGKNSKAQALSDVASIRS
ncbi:MAG: DNA (cytosine-5-)-methyltransferase [Acidobacteriales bacterium]|nr:DNA (cytosine-5-)-methyltransferase [Terriglobales bacterium]